MAVSYILCLFSLICGALEAFCSQNLFLLWLKYQKAHFSQANISTYTLGIQAVGIVSNIAAAVYIDATGHRVAMGVLACMLQLISAVILIVPDVSFAATFFAYYNAGTSYIVNPLLFGWANVICQRGGDDALRSVILGSMNASSQVLYTFWGIVLYSSSDAPYWRNGCIGMFVVIGSLLAMLGVVQWLDKNTARKHPDKQITEFVGTEDRQKPYGRVSVSEKERELLQSGTSAPMVASALPV
ncbi:hypothetical protein LTR36_006369 [Oleoguttula mirabilis]|uniref:Uncharacterized protein n=1 Tax=Oleoguttula mirabilis TaxID=1507867 RepID=A0AAV9JUH4_9PEZI|nr:hypothetical protein LTR36_006369 [Oleoguttula mirabilis]